MPSLKWTLVCLSLVVFMAVLRLSIYKEQIVPLAYSLPLLVSLWHRDLRLLWGMAAAFTAMLGAKLLVLVPSAHAIDPVVFALMQAANILIPAGVLHRVIRLRERLENAVESLEQTNSELEASNEELAAREEEITQQNEELQSQAEELEQQAEELAVQAEELQGINEELAARERTLADLLESTVAGEGEAQTLATLGETVRRLLGGRAQGVVMLEARGAEFLAHPLAGVPGGDQRVRRGRMFAELVMSRDRAGCLSDLSLRPDLQALELEGGVRARSVAAAPIRLGDGVSGALEVYSLEAGEWDEHELRLVQWIADQCGRLWTTSRLREHLRGQQRLLRTVTDNSAVALFMTDEDGVCTYANPAAERLTGYSLAELRAGALHRLLQARGDVRAWAAPDADGSDASGCDGHEEVFVRKGGGEVAVLVSSSAVSDAEAEGSRRGWVVEAQDATERRRHAAEREQLLQSERAARSEAERANHAKDEFVATLSHELRTPLNAVLGWAALLRKNMTNPAEVSKGVEVIERNARHQSQLISDLLDISRITAGKIRLDVQAVDVPLVVEGALESVRPAAEAKGVRLERVIESVDRAVMGDPGRLQQVVWNLLSNAIKFTPRDGRVQVVVSRTASYVQISVSDTGEGIPADVLPHLFERYRQGDGSASRRHGGLGLGLAIAKHLVELHGGSIHARSDGQGMGSSFSILLPVRAAEPHGAASGPHPHTQAALPLDSSAPTLGGFRVLVVDDEEDARDLVGRILRDRGAEVVTASSGDEALRLLEADHPNLLVSDIGMPGMDGYTLVRTVRERWPGTARDLPAVALTAFARSEDRTRALLAGFQSHIAKPVEAAELVATVASLRYAIPGFRVSQGDSGSVSSPC